MHIQIPLKQQSLNATDEFKQKLSKDLYFIRGFAIFFVVVGHVIGHRSAGIRQLYPQDIPIMGWVYSFIYTFHMPIFFIISGISLAVFSKSNTSYFKFAESRLYRLIIPFVCWSPIYFLLRSSSGKIDFSLIGMFEALLSADFIFWFFPALLFTSTLALIIIKNFNLTTYAIISIILGIFCIYIKGILSTMMYFNIFFTFGYLTVPYLLKLWLAIKKLKMSYMLIFATLLIIAMLAISQWVQNQYILKFANGLLAFHLIFLLANLPIDKINNNLTRKIAFYINSNFIYFGKVSMSIYLLHIIYSSFTRILLVKLGVTDIAWHLGIGLSISLLGPIVTYILLQQRQVFLYSIGEAKI
jgi:fucose 4-O-acetylase-like acetyltransferase